MNTNPALLVLGTLGSIVVLIVSVIAWCKIFAKAHIHPGKFFIPYYGEYLRYSIADCRGLFIAEIVLSVIAGFALAFSGFENFTSFSYSDHPGIFLLLGAVVLIFFILHIIFSIRLAQSFEQNFGFAVGLIFLNPIFLCILAFGKAKYDGVYRGTYI